MIEQTWEHQYLMLLEDIYQNGEDRIDRTGTGTRALFGKRLDIDLKAGFPLVTTKKMPFKMIKSELLWFLEGSGDERRLAEIHYGNRDPKNRTIWTDNAEASYWTPKAKFDGDLGRVYGTQWRSWQTYKPMETLSDDNEKLVSTALYTPGIIIDQIAEAIDKIKTNPTDRRILVSAWNVGELSQMALPPCHMFFQLFVSNKRELSLQMYQRSVDSALGLPFNIASYALLTHMIAQVTDCTVGRLIMDLGDTHIYKDHIQGVIEQLQRKPKAPPSLQTIDDIKHIDDFKMGDISINGYTSHPAIDFKMSV